MRLVFLGTRGEIEARSPRHARHSSLLVCHRRGSVMVDAGADWKGELPRVGPHAVVVTHAHPDHAHGLREGTPRPVYATAAAWERMRRYPIPEAARHTIEPRKPFLVEGLRLEAFPLEHSVRCPAVGYRIAAGRQTIFYAPDVAAIHDRRGALAAIGLYVGDGATLARSMVRRRGEALIGHAPVREQLAWCREEGVRRAVFTHCGSGIVKADEREVDARLQSWAREYGVRAALAYDGMQLRLS